ncbi:MAG: hypothetical protein JNM27_21385 [Leptospirales bacterium]|nr:hypothetical protein [Leptospirales bacterium]
MTSLQQKLSPELTDSVSFHLAPLPLAVCLYQASHPNVARLFPSYFRLSLAMPQKLVFITKPTIDFQIPLHWEATLSPHKKGTLAAIKVTTQVMRSALGTFAIALIFGGLFTASGGPIAWYGNALILLVLLGLSALRLQQIPYRLRQFHDDVIAHVNLQCKTNKNSHKLKDPATAHNNK